MFYSRSVTYGRIEAALTGILKIPHIQAGCLLDHTGFGFDEAGNGTSSVELDKDGFINFIGESTLAGDKYRCLYLSKIYDLTHISWIYVKWQTIAGSAGSKHFAVGAVRSTKASLNTDPDISLVDEVGSTDLKQRALITSHDIESYAIDVRTLSGNCNIFVEMYCYDSVAGDTSQVKIFDIVLEA